MRYKPDDGSLINWWIRLLVCTTNTIYSDRNGSAKNQTHLAQGDLRLAFYSGPRKAALVDRGPLNLNEEAVRPPTSHRTLSLVILSSRFQLPFDFGAHDATIKEGPRITRCATRLPLKSKGQIVVYGRWLWFLLSCPDVTFLTRAALLSWLIYIDRDREISIILSRLVFRFSV